MKTFDLPEGNLTSSVSPPQQFAQSTGSATAGQTLCCHVELICIFSWFEGLFVLTFLRTQSLSLSTQVNKDKGAKMKLEDYISVVAVA